MVPTRWPQGYARLRKASASSMSTVGSERGSSSGGWSDSRDSGQRCLPSVWPRGSAVSGCLPRPAPISGGPRDMKEIARGQTCLPRGAPRDGASGGLSVCAPSALRASAASAASASAGPAPPHPACSRLASRPPPTQLARSLWPGGIRAASAPLCQQSAVPPCRLARRVAATAGQARLRHAAPLRPPRNANPRLEMRVW